VLKTRRYPGGQNRQRPEREDKPQSPRAWPRRKDQNKWNPFPRGGKNPFSDDPRGGESLPHGSRSLQIQAEKVRGYILGNQAAWIAAIGLKTGLFRAVSARSEKGVSEDALSKDTGFDLRAVRAWCRSAYAFGFLEWEQESVYRLGPHMEELLLKPDHPAYQGGQIEFYAALNESYRRYPQFLRSGENDKGESQDPWLLPALRNLTRPDARMITDYVLPQAPGTLARILAEGKILDIGSGEGFHLLRYTRRYPRSRVIGLEL